MTRDLSRCRWEQRASRVGSEVHGFDQTFSERLSAKEWIFLQPEKWNKHVQYAWRFDPCELVSQGAGRAPPRAPRLDTEEPWVTDDQYDPSDDFQ